MTNVIDDNIKSLSRIFWNSTEAPRLLFEMNEFNNPHSLAKVLAEAPKGDGHPVIVIPGFMAPGWTTYLLRRALKKAGYKVYSWGAGSNSGITDEKIKLFHENTKKVFEENDGQKITLVGHSLGGFYALLAANAQRLKDILSRAKDCPASDVLANDFPEMVRSIITLGSPIGVGNHRNEVPKSLVSTIEKRNSGQFTLQTPGMTELLLTPPKGVPVTTIASEGDGIGGSRACRLPETAISENIVLPGYPSHTGLGVCNLDALTVILDRLAQPADPKKWRRFDAPERKPRATSRNNSGRRRPGAQPS